MSFYMPLCLSFFKNTSYMFIICLILSHRSLRLYESFFHFFPPCFHNESFILIYSEVHWLLLFVVFNMLLRPFILLMFYLFYISNYHLSTVIFPLIMTTFTFKFLNMFYNMYFETNSNIWVILASNSVDCFWS